MAQGPSASPDFFSPPAPWGAAATSGLIPGSPTDNNPVVEPPFVASSTTVFAPTLLAGLQQLPFIASATAVYAPIFSGSGREIFDVTTSWVCPPDVATIKVQAWGGGGGGASSGSNRGTAGGGGGAYAEREIPVTPGVTYTVTVGAGGLPQVSPSLGPAGPAATAGGTSTFVGDGGVTVSAVGGGGASDLVHGAGGLASASTGSTKHSGANGGDGVSNASTGGAGGGEAGGTTADGHAGTSSGGGNPSGQAGGSGGDGGDGGIGGDYVSGSPAAGSAPGGAGGGAGGFGTSGGNGASGRVIITLQAIDTAFIPAHTSLYAPQLVSPYVFPPFISSTSALYVPALQGSVNVPFISSATTLYAPVVRDNRVDVPFISAHTTVFPIVSIWRPTTGPGNGGETFPIQLAPAGTTVVATLTSPLGSTATTLLLSGDSSLPSTGYFCLTVDDEIIYVTRTSPGTYRVLRRALSNTVLADHAAGASAAWHDTYLMAVASANDIAKSFVYAVDGNTYDAWLICFDSTQARLGGSRYPSHVDQFAGIYTAGGLTSKLDGAQPSARHTTATVSDDCPSAITVPARVITDIAAGDVALLRYTNVESSILTLTSRAAAIQSWYAFSRRDALNNDVTATDPNGTVVDASINVQDHDAAVTTTTLPGTDRTYTYGPPRFSDKGWPLAALSVRQDRNRIPRWSSPDWHDFTYVYSGFADDATYVQVLINRNGYDYAGVVEESVAFPTPLDTTGPNATWDDNSYYFGSSWYVAIFAGATLFVGPSVSGEGSSSSPAIIPSVHPGSSGGGGGGGVGYDSPPPTLEGGGGGDIDPPPGLTVGRDRFWVALV